MPAFYNDINAHCAAWLRELAARGLIPQGRVDDRSVVELGAADVTGPGPRHFFAGIGGWPLACRLAGIPDDADIWSGSCPCQPFSDSGRRTGTEDKRHLWPAWFRLVAECRPSIVVGEQVATPAGLGWLDGVFADLEGAGYACAAADLCAASVGAPHRRQRLFWLAHTNDERCKALAASWLHADRKPRNDAARRDRFPPPRGDADAWRDAARRGHPEPGVRRVADGLPLDLEYLRAYGNAVVPQVTAEFLVAGISAIGAMK